MVDKQQQLLEAMNKGEVKVEGIRLPQFYGKMEASVDFYFEQLAQYFEAKNIDWQNGDQSSRILAITTANFKGNAAAWYKLNKREIKDMQDLIAKLTDEFVPPDLQVRLRDQLYALKQNNCPNLEEYLSRFREAIMQVTDMSELDKITYFIRGLVSPTREEVQYRRITTVSQAMKIALEYDRSHHIRGKNFRPSFVPQDRSGSNANGNPHHQQPAPAHAQENEPEPMEIDSGSTRNRRSSSSSKRCRHCKKTGHVIEQCFKLKNKEKYARQNKQSRHEQSAANCTAASSSSHAAATQESTAKSDDEVDIVEVEEISTST
ncbi:Retroelement pol Polyprotein [Phytophthora cinnamomi]|uniref:Retroelement pol Polyprotein n=1 Tax=Phytophthora cinnamomi TaxID=4785 RepID=UPI0035597CB3|nr:Retroelement pol Polyprotein [Phytophthora cinnamomi]